MPFSFKMDGEYKGSPDQDQQSKRGNSGEGWIDGDGSNDVSGHEKIETEHHALLGIGSEGVKPIPALLFSENEFREERIHKSGNNDENTDQLDHLSRDAGCFDQIMDLVGLTESIAEGDQRGAEHGVEDDQGEHELSADPTSRRALFLLRLGGTDESRRDLRRVHRAFTRAR